MAKVTAPLFSFGARGKLANTLVYFPWKGIDAVRSYVVPSNPQSAGQQTQRSYMTAAVDMWHTLGLTADDVTAWNRYAATRPKPQSGFNAFCSSVIERLVFGLAEAALAFGFNGSISDSGAAQVDFSVDEDGSATAVIFHWGYTPTSLIEVANGVETANVWDAADVSAASGSTVYMRAELRNVTPETIGWTGIYRFGPVT